LITPHQKLHRRVVFQLLLISAALFALNAVTGGKGRTWDDEANDRLRMRRIHNRAQLPKEPKSWSPGERTTIPIFEEIDPEQNLELAGDEVVESEGETPPESEETEPLKMPKPLSGDALVEAIQETVAADVKPKVKDCLHIWWMLDPNLGGRVVVGFQLGPDGLGAAWVQDHSGVPLGPLTCFGSAIADASWPWAAEETEVRFPFVFDSGEADTGGAEEDPGQAD